MKCHLFWSLAVHFIEVESTNLLDALFTSKTINAKCIELHLINMECSRNQKFSFKHDASPKKMNYGKNEIKIN